MIGSCRVLFHACTADFQDITVQATVTFRLTDPDLAATCIDFAIDPETGAWRGAPLDQVAGLLTEIAQQYALEVRAITDDGQQLLALNEIYLGHPSHQTARYRLTPPDATGERQASSRLIVATGTGSTGWCRSAWLERHSQLALPAPTERRLVWFVREAWPSPTTGTEFTEGELTNAQLSVHIESDQLVAFGDGIETDHLTLTWGQTIVLDRSPQTLQLVT